VTTPKSLYILLTSDSGRELLGTVRTVILDEIHALASNKRGAHLALSLERLEAPTGQLLQRVWISATQGPAVTDMAHFLLGTQETRSVDVSSACMGRMPALQFAGVPPAIHDCSPFDTQPPLRHHRFGP